MSLFFWCGGSLRAIKRPGRWPGRFIAVLPLSDEITIIGNGIGHIIRICGIIVVAARNIEVDVRLVAKKAVQAATVSYTQMTLPTNREVEVAGIAAAIANKK